MKKTLAVGVTGEARHRVVTENLVSFHKPDAPAVLATPWLLHVTGSPWSSRPATATSSWPGGSTSARSSKSSASASG